MEALEDRKHKSAGLSGARLGGGQHVVAGEDLGDGVGLDGRGGREAQGVDGSQQLRAEAQLVEGCGVGRLGV